jgi:hypothetical protein
LLSLGRNFIFYTDLVGNIVIFDSLLFGGAPGRNSFWQGKERAAILIKRIPILLIGTLLIA